MIENFKIYETRQEAESFLKRIKKEKTDPDFLKIRELCQKTPSLLGIITKIFYSNENVTLEKVKEILKKFDKYKNDFKRDKVNPQQLLNTAFKQENTLEVIEDKLDLIELKNQTLSFINSLQHSSVRKELKDKYYQRIEQGIISLKSVKDWEKQLNFISSKSARYKTGSEVVKVFETLIRNVMGGFSPESIVNKINSTAGAILVYNKNGFVVAQVFTREASCAIGSSSWCISGYRGSYFDSYANPREKKQQYFIWDTSKSPSDNHSLMGVTLFSDGRVHTAHLKNDYRFDHRSYFNKLVKSGECDKDLYNLLTSKIDNNNSEVSVSYMIYGGQKVSVTVFKKLFKNEWNKSKRETVDDFTVLFNLYETVTNVNNITPSMLNQRSYVTYKRLYNDLLDFAKKLNFEDLFSYLVPKIDTSRGGGHRNVQMSETRVSVIKELMKEDQFKNIPSIEKAEYIVTLGLLNKLGEETNIDLNITDDNLSLVKKDRIVILLGNIILINLKYYNMGLTINVGNLKEFKIDSSNLEILRLFFGSLNGNIICDHLHIIGYDSKKLTQTYLRKVSANKITFENISNSYNSMGRIIGMLKPSEIVILNSNINFDKTPINKSRKIDVLTIRRSVANGSIFPSKILNVKFSEVENIDNKNHDEVNLTTDVIYNMSDENKKGLKYNIIGGLPLMESLKSKLLTSLYKHIDKNKIKLLFKLLSSNGIDLREINDDQLKYIPSFKVKEVADKEKTSDQNFTLICINEDEGLKYIVNFHKKTTWGNTRWDIKFYDEYMKRVTASDKDLKKSEYSKLYTQTKLPSFKSIKEECDYVIMIKNKDFPSSKNIQRQRTVLKRRSPYFETDVDRKKRLIGKLDDYVKNKYLFKKDGEDYTIDYINKIIKRVSSVYNILNYKRGISSIINQVKKYANGSDNDVKKITDHVQKYLNTSKTNVITNCINNLYVVNDDKKIYPDVDKLNTLKNNLENIEKMVREYYSKNNITIEFISDLDVFSNRTSEINNYISSLLPHSKRILNINDNLMKITHYTHEARINYEISKILRRRIRLDSKDKDLKNELNRILDILIEETSNCKNKLRLYFSI